MQRPTGLEPVGMCRDSAHGMKADWAPNHFGMGFTAKISPFLIQLDGLVKGNAGDFGSDPADFISRYSDPFGDRICRITWVQIALGHQVKNWLVGGAAMPIGGR